MFSKADLDYIRQLKAEPYTGYEERAPDGTRIRVRILGRGEVAFYQQGERALLFEILAGRGVIFAPSIRRWDDKTKVSNDEREAIIAVTSRLLRHLGADTIEVVQG